MILQNKYPVGSFVNVPAKQSVPISTPPFRLVTLIYQKQPTFPTTCTNEKGHPSDALFFTLRCPTAIAGGNGFEICFLVTETADGMSKHLRMTVNSHICHMGV